MSTSKLGANNAYEELTQTVEALRNKNKLLQVELESCNKELQVIYKISSLMTNDDLSLDEVLQEIVNIVPTSWQFPEKTCARISIGNNVYKTSNFDISDWQLSETIFVDKKAQGAVDIFFLGEVLNKSKNPFQKEERKQLVSFAEKIGQIATRKLLEEEFTAIFKESPVAKCIVDLDNGYRFSVVNKIFLKQTQYTRKELIGKKPSQVGLLADVRISDQIISQIEQKGFLKDYEFEYYTKNREKKSTILNTKVIRVNGRNLAIASFIDLTKIKSAQDQLKVTEARYRSLVESQTDVILRSDFAGNLTFMNHSYSKTFGGNKGEAESHNFIPTVFSEDVPKILKVLELLKQPPYKKYIEIRNITIDGIRWFGWDNMAVLDSEGRIMGVQCVGRDITQRKLAEEKLKDRNEFNSALINTIPCGMDIIDESGVVLFANENMRKWFGEDIVGKKCWHAYMEDKKQCIHCPLNQRLDLTNDGINIVSGMVGDKICEVSLNKINFKGHEAVLQVFHDITPLKKTEKELRLSEQKFRALFESMNEGFALHQLIEDENGVPVDYRLINVNSSFERILGISVERAEGSLARELYGTVEAPYLKEYATVVKTGISTSFETYFPQLDSHFYISVNSPQPGYFSTIFSDVSERIRNTEKIRRNEKQFKLIADNVSDVIWMYNLAQQRFTYVSSSIDKLRGYAPEEAGVQTMQEMVHPQDFPRIIQLISEYENRMTHRDENPPIMTEVRLRTRSGKYIWSEMSAQFLRNKNGEIEIFGIARNIAERKKAELVAQEHQIQLNSALDIAGLGYYIVSGSANDIVQIDRRAKDIFGIDERSNQFKSLLEFWLSNVNEKNRKIVDEFHKKIYSGEIDSNSVTYRYRHPSKGLIWIKHNAEILRRDDANEDIKVFGVIQDITDLKKQEEELIRSKEEAEGSEQRFRAIADQSTEGITVTDFSGNFVFVNQTFCEMTGYLRDELLEMTVFNLLRENNIAQAKAVYGAENRKGGKRHVTLYCKDGSFVQTEITGTLVELNKQKLVLETIRDISEIINYQNELIAAKEKAEESDYRLRLAVKSGKLGIWDWNVKEDIMIWNDRMYQLYDLDNKLSPINLKVWAKQLFPDDKERALDEVESALHRYSEYNTVFRIVHSSGTVLTIKSDCIVLRDKNDEAVRMIGINRDITKSVEREQELIRARNKAEESDRLKSAFLANVSHEIRTPMNGILGFISLLDEPNLTEEERRAFMSVITQSGERLLNTINDIVMISKIEVGDIKLYYERTDINVLMQYYASFFGIQANKKKIDFVINNKLNTNEVIVNTDKQKLDGILINLIKNAIKFTEKGAIEVGCYRELTRLYFYVSDSGMGIPEDKLAVIFDRFVQIESGNTRSYEGSGIGLSIVKAYLNAMNGDIQVKSELGKGSIFLFSIPFSSVTDVS